MSNYEDFDEIVCPFCGSDDVECIGEGEFFCNDCEEEFAEDDLC